MPRPCRARRQRGGSRRRKWNQGSFSVGVNPVCCDLTLLTSAVSMQRCITFTRAKSGPRWGGKSGGLRSSRWCWRDGHLATSPDRQQEERSEEQEEEIWRWVWSGCLTADVCGWLLNNPLRKQEKNDGPSQNHVYSAITVIKSFHWHQQQLFTFVSHQQTLMQH